MTIPEMVPCESSNIRSRSWSNGTLFVQFIGRNGKPDSIYSYEGVSHAHWLEWLNAASAGSWFSQNIKGKYPAQKIQ